MYSRVARGDWTVLQRQVVWITCPLPLWLGQAYVNNAGALNGSKHILKHDHLRYFAD